MKKILETIGWIILILFGAWCGNEVQKDNAKRALYEFGQEHQRK